MAKKHNWVTGPNHKIVDRDITAATQAGICGCNHLTPQTEAEMENLITPGSVVVPTRQEIIAQNEPGYLTPVSADLETPIDDWDMEPLPPEVFEYNQELPIDVASD